MQPNEPVYPQQNIQPNIPAAPPSRKSPLSIILVIVGGLVLAGVLFTGGLLLGQSSQKTSSQVEIDKANQEVEGLRNELAATGAVVDEPGVTYLTIEEWGVRLPLDEKFKDVKYRFRTRLNADFVELYSPTMAAIATCRDYQGEIGTIERAAAGEVPTAGANVVGISKYLYMYKSKTETCTSNPANIETPYKASLLKQFALLETSGKAQDGDDGNQNSDLNAPVSSEPAQSQP
ncbi:MAG: hypothetical protein U0520_04610 [Candidatus Saccharimonadales bacterium]